MTNLATEVARLKHELAQVKKGQRIAHGASIENAAIEVRDDDGSLRAIVGQQGDGTTGVLIVNGPTPPQPSTPIVASVLGGVTASWDGLFAAGAVMPLDWARIEVHASTSPGFTPDPVTLQSTIETAQGATVVVPCENNIYVRFLARTTSGTASAPSVIVGPAGPAPVVASDILDGIVTTVKLADDAVTAAKVAASAINSTALADGAVLSEKLAAAAVSVGKIADNAVTGPAIASDAVTAGKVAADAITAREIAAGSVTAAEVAAGAITTDKLTVTGGGNMLSDPSFEGPYTAALVVGDTNWSIDATKGNGSVSSLKVNAAAGTPTNRDLTLTTITALPGDQFFVAVDYQASTDYVGTPRIYCRWENSSGAFLSSTAAQASPPVLGATWQRITATVTAPATAAKARINVASTSGSAGSVWFDNAACRPVSAGVQIADGAITTPKLVAGAVQTLQLDAEAVNASKIAAGAVTTAKLDALAVTADKIAANTITAGKLAAGSVDAVALKADAITGKAITGGTITGATIQTAATGRRIVMTPAGTLEMYSGETSHSPGVLESGTIDSGAIDGWTRLQAPAPSGTVAELVLSGAASGMKTWELGPLTVVQDPPSTSTYPDTQVIADCDVIAQQNVTILGTLTAGNHAVGTATVTPSAAHTPTSTTVFYSVVGTTFRGFATLNSTVPGVRTPVGAQGVTGVSVSSATATSMLVWVNRENTAATNVNWQVWSS